MKYGLLVSIVFLAFNGFSQLIDGSLVQSGRRLLTPTDFKLSSNFKGEVYFEIAVDNLGKVTNVRFIQSQTTTNSTPARIEAQNFIKKLEFESGTYFPKFQHAKVRVILTE